MKNKYIVISGVMHLILFFALMQSSKAKDEQNQQETGVDTTQVEIVSKQDTTPNTEPDQKDGVGSYDQATDCEGYGGIGVVYDAFTGTITKVHSGYPAARAGIEPGDIIMSPTISSIKGDPGTELTLIIKRGGSVYSVVLTRELICTNIK